jgi:hypothetical protein
MRTVQTPEKKFKGGGKKATTENQRKKITGTRDVWLFIATFLDSSSNSFSLFERERRLSSLHIVPLSPFLHVKLDPFLSDRSQISRMSRIWRVEARIKTKAFRAFRGLNKAFARSRGYPRSALHAIRVRIRFWKPISPLLHRDFELALASSN